MPANSYKPSIAFNYHLDTDAPRFQEAVAALQTFLAPHLKNCDKRLARDNIAILLLNFMRLLNSQPLGTWVRYSRKPSFKKDLEDTLGNPWRASRKLWDIIEALEAEKLVDHEIGGHKLLTKRPVSEQSCVKPVDAFVLTYLIQFHLLGAPLKRHQDTPLIRYRQPKDDDPVTSRWRTTPNRQMPATGKKAESLAKNLALYNALLEETIIELVGSNADTSETFTYRVFSDKNLTTNGRFHGAFWQNLKGSERRNIRINGEATVELDFKNNHPYLAYALYTGQSMESHLGEGIDAYKLPLPDGAGHYPRSLGKLLFLMAFNAKGKQGLRGALVKDLESKASNEPNASKEAKEASQGLLLLNEPDGYKKLYGAFQSLHRPLENHLFKQCWKKLTFCDAAICAYVIDAMTAKGIPVLTIHDSFICQVSHRMEVETAMKQAYTALGMPLAIPPIVPKS